MDERKGRGRGARGADAWVRALEDRSPLLGQLATSMKDVSLLKLALTHSSSSAAPANYERLEFLGDSVLGFVVVEAIYHRFPKTPEGELARVKASLVSARTLSEIAEEFGFFDAAILGDMPQSQLDMARMNVGADIVESVIGAIYLDQGMGAAKALIERVFGARLSAVKLSEGAARDAKSALHELVQGALHERPVYEVIQSDGPPHARRFLVQARILGHLCGEAWGSSHKNAEQGAASEALRRIEAGDLDLEKLRPA